MHKMLNLKYIKALTTKIIQNKYYNINVTHVTCDCLNVINDICLQSAELPVLIIMKIINNHQ